MIFGMTYYQICWYFLFYSFCGWVLEVIFHAAALGRIVNRGFLNGPICPVYGFGALAVFSLTGYLQQSELYLNDFSLFVSGVLLATLVELIAGWLMDKCFHARWWDYSEASEFSWLHLPGVFPHLGSLRTSGCKAPAGMCRQSAYCS